MTEAKTSEIVIHFDRPHALGSRCVFPCIQCGESRSTPGTFTLRDSTDRLPLPTLIVLRQATRENYLEQCRKTAANGVEPPGGYFYWVIVHG